MKQQIFQYDEIRPLSKNMKSPVWLVCHETTGRYAVKRQVTEEEAVVYRRMLHLESAHLPKIYEVCHVENSWFVLEEYISGQTLDRLLELRLCSEEEAKIIILQLCDALLALHAASIIHRDIKPQNIVISEAGQVYLIDFNIARLHKESKASDTEYLGTAGYAAPEQFGFGQSDCRSDIYSLGVLFNELLTGKLPKEHLYQGDLTPVIETCTAIAPEDRFQDIQILKDRLLGLSEERKTEILEEFKETRNTDRIYCSILQWAVIVGLIAAYVHNCVDPRWALGFDFFAQTAKEYLGPNHTVSTIGGFIMAIPFTGWMKMITLAVILIVLAQLLKRYFVPAGIAWLGFFCYDLHWQISGLFGNRSIFIPASAIAWQDWLNIGIHVVCMGLIVKTLYDKKKTARLAKQYKNV